MIAQRVLLSTNGVVATAVFPVSPQDGDAIWVSTTPGTAVVNPAALNPNGLNIIDPRNPGTVVSGSNVNMGVNPGATALFIFESSGTLWRQWA